MSINLRVVNGVVVTDTEVPPPRDWTNDYEEIGGEFSWGEFGEMAEEIRGRAINGEIKPLFGMPHDMGAATALFQVGNDQFYFFDGNDRSLFRILSPPDLQGIVSTINDEDMGVSTLELEAL